MSKTMLITGVSTGLGRAIAAEALARGHRVVGTVRTEESRAAFEALRPGHAFGRILDVTRTAEIAPLVASIEATAGPIDVLINNAGYGHRGVVEEITPDELRRQLEVNVIGAVAVIQAVLPPMRARRRGHILNMSSMGATVTFPGLAAYHASKFALQGIGDTLAAEVAPLGIHVTSLQPGLFRSDWSGRSLAQSRHMIADYDAVLDPPDRAELQWGDPATLARVVLEATEAASPPLHLPIGPTAVRSVRGKLAALLAEVDALETWSMSTGEG